MAKRDPVVRDTKDRILAAALVVFGEGGYRDSSIDDVAAAAGVTKGAVYYYFSDKDDLARDLQHQLWEQLATDAVASFDPGRSTVVNLEACFGAFLVSLSARPTARAFLREAWFTPALDTSGRADQESMLGMVQGILEQGMATGDVRRFDPEALTRVLVGALMEATLYVLGPGEADAAMPVVRHFVASLATVPAEVG